VNPDATMLLVAQAGAYAADVTGNSTSPAADYVRELLRSAFMRGAEAGYLAAKAEDRK
jgi:hypothetical protein